MECSGRRSGVLPPFERQFQQLLVQGLELLRDIAGGAMCDVRNGLFATPAVFVDGALDPRKKPPCDALAIPGPFVCWNALAEHKNFPKKLVFFDAEFRDVG